MMGDYYNSVSYIRNANFRVFVNWNSAFISAKHIDLSFYFNGRHKCRFKMRIRG